MSIVEKAISKASRRATTAAKTRNLPLGAVLELGSSERDDGGRTVL